MELNKKLPYDLGRKFDLDGLMVKLESLGKYHHLGEGNPQRLVPNFLVETRRGFNYYNFMADMCNAFRKYNLLHFEGSSDYIEIMMNDIMIERPGLTEEILAARFIEASEMTHCFKGMAVLNFQYIENIVSENFIEMLSTFINSVGEEIKFAIIFTEGSNGNWIENLTKNAHFERVFIGRAAKKDLVDYSVKLFSGHGLIMNDEACTILKQQIERMFDSGRITEKSALEALINKMVFEQITNGHTRFTDNKILATSLSQYEQIKAPTERKAIEIGFRG